MFHYPSVPSLAAAAVSAFCSVFQQQQQQQQHPASQRRPRSRSIDPLLVPVAGERWRSSVSSIPTRKSKVRMGRPVVVEWWFGGCCRRQLGGREYMTGDWVAAGLSARIALHRYGEKIDRESRLYRTETGTVAIPPPLARLSPIDGRTDGRTDAATSTSTATEDTHENAAVGASRAKRAKQSKAKQSKAKQSKAKQSKAKRRAMRVSAHLAPHAPPPPPRPPLAATADESQDGSGRSAQFFFLFFFFFFLSSPSSQRDSYLSYHGTSHVRSSFPGQPRPRKGQECRASHAGSPPFLAGTAPAAASAQYRGFARSLVRLSARCCPLYGRLALRRQRWVYVGAAAGGGAGNTPPPRTQPPTNHASQAQHALVVL